MIQTGLNLEMHPDLTAKLSAGRKLWQAAHEDGSANRVDADAVLDAAATDTCLGILTATAMWIRKKFRNRGKTREDFAAEKEAADINRSCDALDEMLLEYIQSAEKGMVDGEALDELIATLEEMQAYDEAGKLTLPDRASVSEIRKALAKYTAAIDERRSVRPAREAEPTGASEFRQIRELLLRQKELLCKS